MLSAALARARSPNEHAMSVNEMPPDPLDALHSLVSQWQLPSPDEQTARTLIEQARGKQVATGTSPPNTTRSSSPFDMGCPLSYRASHDPYIQITPALSRDHAPIASLPDDILLHIFEYVAGDRTEDADQRLSWLIVTFVCRFWRHVALASATLWNYIPIRTADILLTFVKRSKELPLDLVFDGTSNKSAMQVAVRRISVCNLGPRIRGLHFLDRTVPWLELTRSLPSHLPRLEVLQVDGTEYWTDSPEQTPVGHLLANGAPTLHTLSVTGCSFLPELSPKSASITHLRLARNANFLSPDAILHILSTFPRLQTFYFEMRAQSEDVGALVTAEPRGTVHLPALHSLTIVHVPRVTAHILAHLALPSTASVSLAFPTCDGSLLDAEHTTEEILTHVPALAHFTHLAVAVHEKAGKVSLHAGFGAGEQRFCLQYRRDYNFGTHFQRIAQLMPALTSVSVDLDVGRQRRSIVSSLSENNWRRFLAHLPRVTELRVSSNFSFSHRALFRVLREEAVRPPPTPAAGEDGDMEMEMNTEANACKTWLPALKTLQFTDLILAETKCYCGGMEEGAGAGTYDECCVRVDARDFYARRDAWEYDFEYPDSAALWMEGLRRCLETRSANGARPLHIRIAAESFKKWRASSCHHPEIARTVGGLAELEFVPPGN